jgi:hypothetical protein
MGLAGKSITKARPHFVGIDLPDGLIADGFHGAEHVVEHAVGLLAKGGPVGRVQVGDGILGLGEFQVDAVQRDDRGRCCSAELTMGCVAAGRLRYGFVFGQTVSIGRRIRVTRILQHFVGN